VPSINYSKLSIPELATLVINRDEKAIAEISHRDYSLSAKYGLILEKHTVGNYSYITCPNIH